MPAPDETRAQAVANLGRAIADDCFPNYIFEDERRSYFFFDPDWIFDPGFLDIARTLLDLEQSASICIAHLGYPGFPGNSNVPTFFIEHGTAAEDFAAVLWGPAEANTGWVYQLSRFGCISNVGEWCIYFERDNEIAVIAFRETGSRYAFVLEQLRVAPIEDALALPLTHCYGRMVSAWREGLLSSYRNRGPDT